MRSFRTFSAFIKTQYTKCFDGKNKSHPLKPDIIWKAINCTKGGQKGNWIRNQSIPHKPDFVKLTYLIGGLEHLDYFPFHIWDVIFSIDELIFFKMVETTNQWLNQEKWKMFHVIWLFWICLIYMVGTSNQSVPVAWPLMENLWCQFWRMIGRWLSRPVANAALSPLEVEPICASHALNHWRS